MSLDMVKNLGLEDKMDRAVYGDAKGVGTSSIVGIVKNVELLVGHVEFRLFFMVIESKLPCCILGLDQMRRFKCLIDLDDNVLIFGGKNGVSVPFLSKKESMTATQQMIESSISNSVPTCTSLPAGPDNPNSSIKIGGIGNKIKSLFKSY
jgi:DNA damage-inducible protein 1